MSFSKKIMEIVLKVDVEPLYVWIGAWNSLKVLKEATFYWCEV